MVSISVADRLHLMNTSIITGLRCRIIAPGGEKMQLGECKY
jgi:hypothetical protein